MRPQLIEVIGHVVHARLSMEGLQQAIILEMRGGYRPTFRGHEWGPEHFEVIEAAAQALEASFHLLKWCQFPEDSKRRVEGLGALRSLAPPR